MELTRDGFLDGRVQVWQPFKGYRAGTDPVLLAAATPARPGDSVLELGCGAGVAALCLAARIADLHITGVELQHEYAELAGRNAAENSVRLDVIEADLKNLPRSVRDKSFDHVIANPPFFRAGSAAPEPGRATARHESTPLSNWIETARRRLKPKGWITIILPVDRLPNLIEELDPDFGSVAVKPLSARQGSAPGRFIVKAKKGSNGPFRLCWPLVLHDGAQHKGDADDYSEAARHILRGGAALSWD